MKKFYDDFEPYIPLARYGVGEAAQLPFFTHSVLGPDGVNDEGVPGRWNRTLDYLFIRKGRDAGRTPTCSRSPGRQGITGDPSRLSDHAPIVGTWGLP